MAVLVVSSEELVTQWQMGLPETGGDSGGDLTIPAVMVSRSDGARIRRHLTQVNPFPVSLM